MSLLHESQPDKGQFDSYTNLCNNYDSIRLPYVLFPVGSNIKMLKQSSGACWRMA